MNLKLKWHLKQAVEGTFLLPLSLTAVLVVLIAIRSYKFYTYGIELYPEVHWPKVYYIQDTLRVFWRESLEPLVTWIPLTLPLDLFLRRIVFRLHE